jgi:hypothetical protein
MLLNGDDYHVALYNYIIFHVNGQSVNNTNNDYLNANSILYKGRFYRQYGENLEYTSFDIHYETGPQSLKLNFMVRNNREQHRIGTIVISTSSENLYKYSIPKTININSIGSPIAYDPELLFAGKTVKTQKDNFGLQIKKDKFGLQRLIDGIQDPNHYVIYKTLKAFDKYITNVKKNNAKYLELIQMFYNDNNEKLKLIEQLQLDIYEDKIYFFAQKILAEHFGGKDETFFKPVTEEAIQTKMDAIAQGVLDAPFFQQNLSTVYISSYNPIFEEFKERKKNNVAFELNLVKNSLHAKFKKIYDLYRSKNNIPDNQLNNVLQITGKILEIPSTPVTPDIQLKQEFIGGFNDVFQVSDDEVICRYDPKYEQPTLISSGSNTFQKYGTNVFFENERIGNSSDYVTVCNIYDIMMRTGGANQTYGFATPGSNDRVITYSSDLNLGFNDVDIGNYAVELLQSDKKKIHVDNYDEYDPDDDEYDLEEEIDLEEDNADSEDESEEEESEEVDSGMDVDSEDEAESKPFFKNGQHVTTTKNVTGIVLEPLYFPSISSFKYKIQSDYDKSISLIPESEIRKSNKNAWGESYKPDNAIKFGEEVNFNKSAFKESRSSASSSSASRSSADKRKGGKPTRRKRVQKNKISRRK